MDRAAFLNYEQITIHICPRLIHQSLQDFLLLISLVCKLHVCLLFKRRHCNKH